MKMSARNPGTELGRFNWFLPSFLLECNLSFSTTRELLVRRLLAVYSLQSFSYKARQRIMLAFIFILIIFFNILNTNIYISTRYDNTAVVQTPQTVLMSNSVEVNDLWITNIYSTESKTISTDTVTYGGGNIIMGYKPHVDSNNVTIMKLIRVTV